MRKRTIVSALLAALLAAASLPASIALAADEAAKREYVISEFVRSAHGQILMTGSRRSASRSRMF